MRLECITPRYVAALRLERIKASSSPASLLKPSSLITKQSGTSPTLRVSWWSEARRSHAVTHRTHFSEEDGSEDREIKKRSDNKRRRKSLNEKAGAEERQQNKVEGGRGREGDKRQNRK